MSTTATVTTAVNDNNGYRHEESYELREIRQQTHSKKSFPSRLFSRKNAVPSQAPHHDTIHQNPPTTVNGGTPPNTDPVSSTTGENRIKLQLISCCLCFLVAGLNDGCIGSLMPYLLSSYGIKPSMIGVLHAAGFAGWVAAAILMPIVMAYVGVKGTLMAGAVVFALAQALRVWLPPFPVLAVTFFLVSVGQAFQDAQANTYVATVTRGKSHLWLGFVHAMYGLGLFVSPPLATAIAARGRVELVQDVGKGEGEGGRWAWYFAVPLGVGVVNVLLVGLAFFNKGDSVSEAGVGADAEQSNRSGDGITAELEGSGEQKSRLGKAKQEMGEALKVKAVWIISLFYFFYLGACLSIGNWIVLFLTEEKNLSVTAAGYVPTGFHGGTFLGRLILPHPTHTLLGGERNMLLAYTIIITALQLVSWLVNDAIVTSVMLGLIGFFFGPFFAAGIQVASEVIPRKVRANALGLVFVVAQLGGSVFPAMTGALAERFGVRQLQPLVVALLVAMGAAWWVVPRVPKRREGGKETEEEEEDARRG